MSKSITVTLGVRQNIRSGLAPKAARGNRCSYPVEDLIEDGVYSILISAGKYPDSRKDKIVQPIVTGLDRANLVASSYLEDLRYQERKRSTRYYALPCPFGDGRHCKRTPPDDLIFVESGGSSRWLARSS